MVVGDTNGVADVGGGSHLEIRVGPDGVSQTSRRHTALICLYAKAYPRVLERRVRSIVDLGCLMGV